jgi:hypothetical protein
MNNQNLEDNNYNHNDSQEEAKKLYTNYSNTLPEDFNNVSEHRRRNSHYNTDFPSHSYKENFNPNLCEENDENKLLKTAHFNSGYDMEKDDRLPKNYNYKSQNFHGESDRNSEINNTLREVEDNLKLFEQKMRKLEGTHIQSKNTESLPIKEESEIIHENKKLSYNYKYNNNPTNENPKKNDVQERENKFSKKQEVEEYVQSGSDASPNFGSPQKSKKALEMEKMKNEIFYKDMLIEELKAKIEELENENTQASKNNQNIIHESELFTIKEENETLKKYIENLKNENHIIRTNYDNLKNQNNFISEEFEILKKVVEGLKRENTLHRNSLLKKDDEYSSLKIKISDLEKDNSNIQKKLSSEEALVKNLKMEYDNMTKNFLNFKKQFESVSNKLEEYKADNYNLKIENTDLKAKMNPNQKNKNNQSNLSLSSQSGVNTFPDRCFYERITPVISHQSDKILTTKIERFSPKHDDVYYPSETKLKNAKNEITFNEEKLSQLMKEKLLVENDLFKLPDRPRTINEINKKRNLEESMNNIENEINDTKFKLRKLNAK